MSVTVLGSLAQATYVSYGAQNNNYNSNDYLRAGVQSTTAIQYQTLIQFGLPSIRAGSVIDSATMRLYSYSDDCYRYETTLLAKRNTAAFTAASATYATKPATTDTDQGSCTASGYDTWYEWEIKDIVQAWVDGTSNYGLTVVQDGLTVERGKCFKKSGTYVPQLEIVYTEPTAPTAPTGLSVSANPFESSLSLFWTKGAGGYNNPVTGQWLEYRVSDDNVNWTTVDTLDVGASVESYTIPAETVAGWSRGNYFSARVGSMSAYESTVYSDWCAAKKNQAPYTPVNVSMSKPVYVPGELARVNFTSAGDPDDNLLGFEVDIGESGIAVESNENGGVYVDVSTAGLTPGISYAFRVRAYDALGAHSAWSASVSALVGLPMKIVTTEGDTEKQVAQMKLYPTEGDTAKTVIGMKIAPAQGAIDKTVF